MDDCLFAKSQKRIKRDSLKLDGHLFQDIASLDVTNDSMYRFVNEKGFLFQNPHQIKNVADSEEYCEPFEQWCKEIELLSLVKGVWDTLTNPNKYHLRDKYYRVAKEKGVILIGKDHLIEEDLIAQNKVRAEKLWKQLYCMYKKDNQETPISKQDLEKLSLGDVWRSSFIIKAEKVNSDVEKALRNWAFQQIDSKLKTLSEVRLAYNLEGGTNAWPIVEAKNLLGFIWWQFFNSIELEKDWRFCKGCNQYFDATGRRTDVKTCSERCRKRVSSRKP